MARLSLENLVKTYDGRQVVSSVSLSIDDGSVAASIRAGELTPRSPAAPFENTTIGVIATNARLDKLGCLHAAQAGHDGLARALVPAHLASDGDALVALATGRVDAPSEAIRVLAALAIEDAVRSSTASSD